MSRGERKIACWLRQRGYRLRPASSYHCTGREIGYRTSDAPATRIAGLLHECGHVLYARRPPGLTGYSDPRGRARSRRSAVDLIREEIEAWHRGHALARRLGIRVDDHVYWRFYGECVISYCKRAAERKL